MARRAGRSRSLVILDGRSCSRSYHRRLASGTASDMRSFEVREFGAGDHRSGPASIVSRSSASTLRPSVTGMVIASST